LTPHHVKKLSAVKQSAKEGLVGYEGELKDQEISSTDPDKVMPKFIVTQMTDASIEVMKIASEVDLLIDEGKAPPGAKPNVIIKGLEASVALLNSRVMTFADLRDKLRGKE
jgi:hypothetical protein